MLVSLECSIIITMNQHNHDWVVCCYCFSFMFLRRQLPFAHQAVSLSMDSVMNEGQCLATADFYISWSPSALPITHSIIS